MASHDIAGEILAKAVNNLPSDGGRSVKATYIPHMAKLVVDVGNVESMRRQIFKENAELYKENRVREFIKSGRPETGGDVQLRIPEYDLIWIKKNYPEARSEAPREDRRKFYTKLAKRNPEYRIG